MFDDDDSEKLKDSNRQAVVTSSVISELYQRYLHDQARLHPSFASRAASMGFLYPWYQGFNGLLPPPPPHRDGKHLD